MQSFSPFIDRESGFYDEEYFHEVLDLERKRTERSRKPLRLMLLDIMGVADGDGKRDLIGKAADVLFETTRETDIKGWYARDAVIGVLFTETDGIEPRALRGKIEEQLMAVVPDELRDKIFISFHALPEDIDTQQATLAALALFPDLPKRTRFRKPAIPVKADQAFYRRRV